MILLGFRVSGFIGRVFTEWVFIGDSPHFEHRVFIGGEKSCASPKVYRQETVYNAILPNIK